MEVLNILFVFAFFLVAEGLKRSSPQHMRHRLNCIDKELDHIRNQLVSASSNCPPNSTEVEEKENELKLEERHKQDALAAKVAADKTLREREEKSLEQEIATIQETKPVEEVVTKPAEDQERERERHEDAIEKVEEDVDKFSQEEQKKLEGSKAAIVAAVPSKCQREECSRKRIDFSGAARAEADELEEEEPVEAPSEVERIQNTLNRIAPVKEHKATSAEETSKEVVEVEEEVSEATSDALDALDESNKPGTAIGAIAGDIKHKAEKAKKEAKEALQLAHEIEEAEPPESLETGPTRTTNDALRKVEHEAKNAEHLAAEAEANTNTVATEKMEEEEEKKGSEAVETESEKEDDEIEGGEQETL